MIEKILWLLGKKKHNYLFITKKHFIGHRKNFVFAIYQCRYCDDYTIGKYTENGIMPVKNKFNCKRNKKSPTALETVFLVNLQKEPNDK